MAMHGLVHDSPIITGVQHLSRRGKKHARYAEQAQRDAQAWASFWKKIGFKDEWLAPQFRETK